MIFLIFLKFLHFISFFLSILKSKEDGGIDQSWEEFFQDWIEGKIHFGKWTEHLKEFLNLNDKV